MNETPRRPYRTGRNSSGRYGIYKLDLKYADVYEVRADGSSRLVNNLDDAFNSLNELAGTTFEKNYLDGKEYYNELPVSGQGSEAEAPVQDEPPVSGDPTSE